MTTDMPFDERPDWNDGAMARAFKPNPTYDAMLAREAAEPGCLDRDGVSRSVRMSLSIYEQFKAGATRHNKRETR